MTNSTLILFIMASHVALTAALYAALTITRAPWVFNIGTQSNAVKELGQRVSANLSNQFEWPVFFYVICLLILQDDAVTNIQISLALLFLIGRVVHCLIQVATTNIRLRGIVFTINFLAVLAMWAVHILQ